MLSVYLSCVCTGVVSLISLAVLSYERYCTMMGSTQADSTNYRKVVIGIAFSWIYSMVWTLPPLFGWSCYGPEGPGTTCSVNWAARTPNNVSYIVCLFVFCLILPFIVIVYSYGRLLQAITQVGVKTVAAYYSWWVIDSGEDLCLILQTVTSDLLMLVFCFFCFFELRVSH